MGRRGTENHSRRRMPRRRPVPSRATRRSYFPTTPPPPIVWCSLVCMIRAPHCRRLPSITPTTRLPHPHCYQCPNPPPIHVPPIPFPRYDGVRRLRLLRPRFPRFSLPSPLRQWRVPLLRLSSPLPPHLPLPLPLPKIHPYEVIYVEAKIFYKSRSIFSAV